MSQKNLSIWYSTKPENPVNGDRVYNTQTKMVHVYNSDAPYLTGKNNWYDIGPMNNEFNSKMLQLFRNQQIEKIIKSDDLL